MEAMSKRVATSDTEYLDKLGEQLLIFRGRGGTGKTVRLLQLARKLFEENHGRSLLLTYNNALAADIRRLLTLLRISDGIGEPGIGVQTVHGLMREWMIALGILDPSDRQYLDKYDDCKRELLELLVEGALTKKDIKCAIRDQSRRLSWEYILVDECQDWPADERDILYRLYDFKRFVLADGMDQLVRSGDATDWRKNIDKKATQVVRLRKSLRVKAGLCEAVMNVANHLEVAGWDLEPIPGLYGGRILVIEGLDYERNLHDSLVQETLKRGNQIIDMLFCVPPALVRESEVGERYSTLGRQFSEWGYETWDGASYGVRASYPISVSQHRIVQYDSCRGLEGWCVVCLSLDKFYDYKKSQFVPPEKGDLIMDPEHLADLFAARWLMIPLTRAIDYLVLQISDPRHPVADILRKTADDLPGIVEWRN
jgi:hypothetical protein